MSREQWGHGYYKGIEDEKNRVKKPKFIVRYDDDGVIGWIYQIIREFDNDVFLLEEWHLSDYSTVWSLGKLIAEDEHIAEDIDEYCVTDWKKKLFYSQEAVASEYIRNIPLIKKKYNL